MLSALVARQHSKSPLLRVLGPFVCVTVPPNSRLHEYRFFVKPPLWERCVCGGSASMTYDVVGIQTDAVDSLYHTYICGILRPQKHILSVYTPLVCSLLYIHVPSEAPPGDTESSSPVIAAMSAPLPSG